MAAKQEIINMVDQLPKKQLKKVVDYIRVLLLQENKGKEIKLEEEQEQLLELLNCTIDTGRGDFAENHNHYLYGVTRK